MSAQDDIARINHLAERLRELCAEGEQIRARIQRIAQRGHVWPERRSLVDAFDRSDGKQSDFTPPREQQRGDQN